MLFVASGLCASCTPAASTSGDLNPPDEEHFGLRATSEVLVTSEAGQKLASTANAQFREGRATGVVVRIDPGHRKQTITGIGSSFTESSAFVLAHLDKKSRSEVMQRIYGKSGANFSLARTVIGSTDFSVGGKYSHAPVPDDKDLEHFSIRADSDGFSKSDYPGIRDEAFDLLPMIQEALVIKTSQNDDLRIVASAWTAPPWMKDIEDWYVGAGPEVNWQGTGGSLKDDYVPTYANYLLRYLDAYAGEGVDIWGLTPVNEPEGNGGHWESMHFTAESQRDFIRDHLGPALRSSPYRDIKLLIYDQNRDRLEHWTDVILGDPQAAQYVYGTAIHWYASTNRVFKEALQAVNAKFPDFDIIHTEGTIDSLGVESTEGVTDPVGFKESGWFDNDAFWWSKTATDWAYASTWAPARDHPMYTPVHRYARNIIVSLDNWVSGWIDWNVVLDRRGGPNHVGNFCGAPIMIDTDTGYVYYTPIYYTLAQFSRTIRPGDTAVGVGKELNGLEMDALHASATLNDDLMLSVQVLNTTKSPLDYALQIGLQYAQITIPANAVQTVRVQLNKVNQSSCNSCSDP